MHSGVFDTLEDVLEFYDDVDDRRGRDRNVNVSREQLDPLLRRLRGVDDDDVDLLAFLRALSDETLRQDHPDPRPERTAGRRAHSVTRHKSQGSRHKSQWPCCDLGFGLVTCDLSYFRDETYAPMAT